MVSWSDGVEYAPTERPDAFAMPRATPLEVPSEPPSPAEGQPDAAPQSYQQAPHERPLESLVPSTGPVRDPHHAFATAPTETGMAGFDPRAPIATTAVLDAPVFIPEPIPVEAPLPPAPARTGPSVSELTTLVGVPMIVCLVVGTVLWMLAFPMLVAALVVVIAQPGRVLAGRLRAALAVAASSALVLSFVLNIMDDSYFSLGRYSQLGCLVCLGLGLWWGWRRLVPSR